VQVGAATVLTLMGVFFIRDIVAPTFLALTLVLTVRPLVRVLNRLGAPKALSALAGLLVVYAFLAGVIWSISLAITALVQALPGYASRFNALYTAAVEGLTSLGLSEAMITQSLRSFDYTSLVGTVTDLMGRVASSTTFVASLVLFLAFIALDLTDANRLHLRLAAVRPRLAAGLVDFAWRVRRYWIVNTIFGLVVALIDVVILVVLGIPLAATWGVLAFVTAYIPNIGFIIGLIPPALMALLANDVQTMVIMVIAYLVVNLISSMVIQPKVTGDAVGLNVTTTFVSLVFWAIVIGPLGPVLAVPLTLFLKSVLIEVDPRTRWFALFLGPVPANDVDPATPSRPPEPPVPEPSGTPAAS
jgi:AI-2 transport protein TqsA